MVINRVGPLSCAKIVGLLYAILGLVIGAIISLLTATLGFVPGREPGNPIFGLASVVVFPIAYGMAGFLATLVAAWLYNGLAGLVGGVEIDVR